MATSMPLVKREIIHEAVGTHLLLTLHGCSSEILNDKSQLGELTRTAAEATGATVLELCLHQFEPQGITALAVLAESHASLHTYPESCTVFWDCFTCGTTCNPELSIPIITTALKPTSTMLQLVTRR
jgi:S-adenosylmethionine decarboxylase